MPLISPIFSAPSGQSKAPWRLHFSTLGKERTLKEPFGKEMTGALPEQEINFQRASMSKAVHPNSHLQNFGRDMLNCSRFLQRVCIHSKKLGGNYTFFSFALMREVLFQNRSALRVHLWRFNWILDKLKTNIQISLRWERGKRVFAKSCEAMTHGIWASAYSQATQPRGKL